LGSKLSVPAKILSGQGIVSPNKMYYAIMQPDCNFVLYHSFNKDFSPSNSIWSSQTAVPNDVYPPNCYLSVGSTGVTTITIPHSDIIKLNLITQLAPTQWFELSDTGKFTYT